MKQETHKVISTKISIPVYRRLEQIARKRGMRIYELMQMVADTLVRYMDDEHKLSPELERAMSIFEHCVGWKDAFSLSDPSAKPDICEATYYLEHQPQGKEKRREGIRAVHVSRPFFGDWHETYDIKTILERTLNHLTPERYTRLRRTAASLDCTGILDLLDLLISEHTSDSDLQEYRELFADNDRVLWGLKPTDQVHVRHNRKDIEKMSEGTLQFNDIQDEEDGTQRTIQENHEE